MKKFDQSLPEFLPKPGMKGNAWSSPKSGVDLVDEASVESTDSSITIFIWLSSFILESIWEASTEENPVKRVDEVTKITAKNDQQKVNIFLNINLD